MYCRPPARQRLEKGEGQIFLGIGAFLQNLTNGWTCLCCDACQFAAWNRTALSVIGRYFGADSTLFKRTTVEGFDRIPIENFVRRSHAAWSDPADLTDR